MMKKFLFALISLCVAASAAASPLSAFAAGALPEPDYPEIFDDPLTFENLTDFAIANDNLMIFADGQTIVHWENENTTVYEFSSAVTNVDYDSVSKNFYYSLNGGTTSFALPDSPAKLPGTAGDHDFAPPHITTEVKDLGNGFGYYYNNNDLVALDKQSQATQRLNLGNAKIYLGKLYAILEHTVLYEVKGLDAIQVEIYYSNFDKLRTISVGDVAEKLNTYATFGENPKYVYVADGAWVTEFDLNLLAPLGSDGKPLPAPEYFPITNPKAQTSNYEVYGPALLLCQSGNVCIVAQGSKVYIMNASSATPLADVEKTSLAEGTTATVNVVGEYAHSLPYMSNATRTFALAPNEVVTVLYEISDSTLAHRFYLVENAEGERGYVIDEFLGDLNVPVPDEGGTSTTPDPDPHTDDYVKTVVLVIVVILLVLIAAGYITWVSTFKQKRVAKNSEGEIDLNDNPDDDNNE